MACIVIPALAAVLFTASVTITFAWIGRGATPLPLALATAFGVVALVFALVAVVRDLFTRAMAGLLRAARVPAWLLRLAFGLVVFRARTPRRPHLLRHPARLRSRHAGRRSAGQWNDPKYTGRGQPSCSASCRVPIA